MKLNLCLVALFAATGAAEVVPRLRAQYGAAARAVPGVVSLLQEEPSNNNNNKTEVATAALSDQVHIAAEKVTVLTDAERVPAIANASEAVFASKDEDKAEDTDSEDAEDNGEDPDVLTVDAPETKVSKTAEPKVNPALTIEAIEQSLIKMGKKKGQKATPGMMKFVAKVEKLITQEMKPKIMDAHKQDQKLLYSYRKQFTKCRKGRQTAQSGIASLSKKSSSSGRSHATCRRFEMKSFKVYDACEDLLLAKEETKKTACQALADLNRNPHSEANNCHPSHTEQFGFWLRRNLAWFRTKRVEYQAAEKKCLIAKGEYMSQAKKCKVKRARHMKQKALCDVRQDSLEETSCSLGKKMSETCHTYSNCYDDTKMAYIKAKPGIKNMERDRWGEWKVLMRVQCLLKVFAEEDGEVDGDYIDECREMATPTKHLELYYPPIPPRQKCKVIPPVPGQKKFEIGFYTSLPTDAKAKPMSTCVVEAGGGVTLGRPRGTAITKCRISGAWLKAQNRGRCALSDDRRRPVKVDYKKSMYTKYTFKMKYLGKAGNRNGNPYGGIKLCAGGRELQFYDSPNNHRWGWSIKHNNAVWARYTSKKDKLLGFVGGKPGKANPSTGKTINVEILTRWVSGRLRLYAWKVNGVVLTKYKNFDLCWGGNNPVPELQAHGSTKGILITDFRAFMGSNPVMSMPQVIGSGVPRTKFTVRCAKSNSVVTSGHRVPGTGRRALPTALACQEWCKSFSGCTTFSWDGRLCDLYWRVLRTGRTSRAVVGPASCEKPYTTGLKADFFWFPAAVRSMPNLDFRKADQSRIDLSVNYANTGGFWPGIRRRDNFAARWKGSLLIKNAGIYYFQIGSDDGSFLWIDGQKVLNNGGMHAYRWRGMRTYMKAGWHSVTMMMFEAHSAAGMYFRYTGPDTMFHYTGVPTEVLRPYSRVPKKRSLMKSQMATPDSIQYYKFPGQNKLLKSGTKTFLLFTVRAKNDAHVTLYSTPIGKLAPIRPKGSYEIVIGGWGNGRSCLRKGPGTACKSFPYTKGIVSKDEYRKFYIALDSKTKEISVGKGHDITKNSFMKWRDPSLSTIKSFAVMTAWGSTGEWIFASKQYGLKSKRTQKLGAVAWYLGDLAADCTTTCAKQGRVCDSNIRAGYSYNKFRQFVADSMGASCTKDSRHWHAQYQPAYMFGGPNSNQGKCLASRNIPHQVRCSGSQSHAMRWCKCSKTTFTFSALKVGRKTWSDYAALAKKKGGRLMTLDEARLLLKRRGMKPIVPGRDAWAAVTNPESRCKDKMDWVQIGNRGHWTGKSHWEYHRCAAWAEHKSRIHADSGYLMFATKRK